MNHKNNTDLLAHCKQELIHAIWRILLNNNLIEAYCDGIIFECFNGVKRYAYPGVFTYTVDYPEKYAVS